METAQKESQLYPPLQLPRPTRFKVRQLYLTVPLSTHVVATDKELVWPPQREDGKLEEKLQGLRT